MGLDTAAGPGGLGVSIVGVLAITASQALVNHLGIRLTTRLTDFSGYWILVVARRSSTVGLLAFAPALDFGRLVTLHQLQRRRAAATSGRATEHLAWLFALGFLLPAYTITGFDASAHAAEETVGAAVNVPRGIVRSVVVSGLAGWVMLCAVVLAMPDLDAPPRTGAGSFTWIVGGGPAGAARRAACWPGSPSRSTCAAWRP